MYGLTAMMQETKAYYKAGDVQTAKTIKEWMMVQNRKTHELEHCRTTIQYAVVKASQRVDVSDVGAILRPLMPPAMKKADIRRLSPWATTNMLIYAQREMETIVTLMVKMKRDTLVMRLLVVLHKYHMIYVTHLTNMLRYHETD